MIYEQTYPDLYPSPPTTIYIPRIYGFKIYKKKGSKFWEQSKNINEITHYGEEQLKKLKAMLAGAGAGAGTGTGSNTQSQLKEEQDNNNNGGQTIFNNVKTQNNIYINAGPAPIIANPNNKIHRVKDNVDQVLSLMSIDK